MKAALKSLVVRRPLAPGLAASIALHALVIAAAILLVPPHKEIAIVPVEVLTSPQLNQSNGSKMTASPTQTPAPEPSPVPNFLPPEQPSAPSGPRGAIWAEVCDTFDIFQLRVFRMPDCNPAIALDPAIAAVFAAERGRLLEEFAIKHQWQPPPALPLIFDSGMQVASAVPNPLGLDNGLPQLGAALGIGPGGALYDDLKYRTANLAQQNATQNAAPASKTGDGPEELHVEGVRKH